MVLSLSCLQSIVAVCCVIGSGESIKDGGVGQFTHQGDNYRVIGVLTLSALTIFVSSLLALPLHKRTQHVRHWKSTKKLLSPRDPRPSCLSDLRGPVCVCLIENMCTILYRCLWTYLHQRIDWNTGDSRL